LHWELFTVAMNFYKKTLRTNTNDDSLTQEWVKSERLCKFTIEGKGFKSLKIDLSRIKCNEGDLQVENLVLGLYE
jgi:hypothetical protein